MNARLPDSALPLEPQVLQSHVDTAWRERIVPELMPLFRTRLVCSGSIGLRKPDPAAFLLCLERLGFSAAATLYVDDKVANAEGARQAGLDAFVFESETQFVQQLRLRALDPGECHAL